MPHRIIHSMTVPAVKPYQLIAALMHRDGLGALPLAKKMGKPKLQPQIHRFIKGDVASPARTTAEPLAAWFKIPTDAIYDEKLATSIAKDRGLSELPAAVATAGPTKTSKSGEEKEVARVMAAYKKMSASERQRFRLLMLAAADAVQPSEAWRAPGRPATGERFEGGLDSGLGALQDAPEIKKRKDVK